MNQQRTWLLAGSVVWVTRAEVTDVSDETDAVKQIYNAIIQINDQQCPGADPVHSLIIHGIDISTVDEFNDTERLANGDVIAITMGVTEFDP
jgi:GH25 family lysozyme M1 (1,4-beta-N-acetylmuramidase)